MVREDDLDVNNIGEHFDAELARIGGNVEWDCSMVWLFDEDLLESVRVGTVINCSEKFMT